MNNLLRVAMQAVKAVPEVAQYLSADTLAALKGGEGSGNFGHEGRPGEVGGSAPSGGGSGLSEIKSAEDRIKDITTHEETVIVDSDGKIIIHKIGEAEKVIFNRIETMELRKNGDATLTHNHPIVASISGGDMQFAIENNIKELRAVDSKYTYIVTRPEGGWIKDDRFGIKSTWTRTANASAKFTMVELGDAVRSGSMSIEAANAIINETATHDAMKAVSKKYGISYERYNR